MTLKPTQITTTCKVGYFTITLHAKSLELRTSPRHKLRGYDTMAFTLSVAIGEIEIVSTLYHRGEERQFNETPTELATEIAQRLQAPALVDELIPEIGSLYAELSIVNCPALETAT